MRIRAWTIASVVASCLLALGLVLRRFDRPDASEPAAAKDAKDLRSTEPAAAHKLASGPAHPLRVAGSVLVIVGVVALLLLAPIAWHARTLRLTTRPGVIITTEAHLTDDTGTAAGGDPIPEAASVEVGDRKAGLVHVRLPNRLRKPRSERAPPGPGRSCSSAPSASTSSGAPSARGP
jgi:hypothetical protein